MRGYQVYEKTGELPELITPGTPEDELPPDWSDFVEDGEVEEEPFDDADLGELGGDAPALPRREGVGEAGTEPGLGVASAFGARAARARTHLRSTISGSDWERAERRRCPTDGLLSHWGLR